MPITNRSSIVAHDRGLGDQVLETPSEKSYAIAVSLSAIFGVIGVQHFYLERWFEDISERPAVEKACAVGKELRKRPEDFKHDDKAHEILFGKQPV